MNMINSERRSTSVPRATHRQDQTTPDHVTVASVSLSGLLKAKICSRNSKNIQGRNFLLVATHISLVPVPLPLVPGSTTFSQCCTRYHPSGTMVPLPFHPRGTSLIGKSVRDFIRRKGFKRIFDGFFLKTKGFLPKVYEIFGNEMPLAFIPLFL